MLDITNYPENEEDHNDVLAPPCSKISIVIQIKHNTLQNKPKIGQLAVDIITPNSSCLQNKYFKFLLLLVRLGLVSIS